MLITRTRRITPTMRANFRIRSKIRISATTKDHLHLSRYGHGTGTAQVYIQPGAAVSEDLTKIMRSLTTPETFVRNLLSSRFHLAPKASGCQGARPTQVYYQMMMKNEACYRMPTARRKLKASRTNRRTCRHSYDISSRKWTLVRLLLHPNADDWMTPRPPPSSREGF